MFHPQLPVVCVRQAKRHSILTASVEENVERSGFDALLVRLDELQGQPNHYVIHVITG